MKLTLQALEQVEIASRGETVVYLTGSEPLLIEASGKRAEIPSGSQITFPVFDQVKIQNKGSGAVEAEILIVEGEFRSLAEGSLVRIQGIESPVEIQRVIDPVSADVSGTVAVSEITVPVNANVSGTVGVSGIAGTVNTNVTNQVNIRAITETLTAQVTGTVNVSGIGGTVAVSQTPNGGYFGYGPVDFSSAQTKTRPANPNRVSLTLKAASANTGVIWVGGQNLGIPLDPGEKIEINTAGSVDLYAENSTDILYVSEVIK